MKKKNPYRTSLILLLAILVAISMSGAVAAVSLPVHPAATDLDGADYVSDELIVTFSRNTTATDRANVHALAALEKIKDLPFADSELVRIKDRRTVAEAIARLQANPRVAAVQPNFIYQAEVTADDDPQYGQLWGLHNTGQTIGSYAGVPDCDIDAPEAWTTTGGSPTVIVAVIDTGVDISHPDLFANIWTNPGETPGNGVDDDNNGYIDDIHGWNFYGDNAQVFNAADGDDHGTHVAGTIAGADNTIGIIGVAPNVRIMPLKFLGPNGGTTVDAIEAIQYAKANGAALANNSWGGGGYDQALYDMIQNFGKPFIAAAGNSKANTDRRAHYPSSYNLPNIVSVASVNNRALLSSFSNYGATSVDLGAPGEGILSSIPGNKYAYYSGTSMAAPHVSGIVALMLSVDPARSGTSVRQILIDTAVDLASLAGKTVSGGMANAAAALAAMGSTPVDKPPVVTISSPADGAVLVLGTTTEFAATANDIEDGVLTGSIVWTSSLDGAIGTGGSFGAVLSVGKHTITATVTDSKGQTASDSVTVTVMEPSSEQFIRVAYLSWENKQVNPATWQAIVKVTVNDKLSGAVVTGTWSNGSTGTATTNSEGQCTIQATFNKKVTSVTFTIENVTLAGFTFDPSRPNFVEITKP